MLCIPQCQSIAQEVKCSGTELHYSQPHVHVMFIGTNERFGKNVYSITSVLLKEQTSQTVEQMAVQSASVTSLRKMFSLTVYPCLLMV